MYNWPNAIITMVEIATGVAGERWGAAGLRTPVQPLRRYIHVSKEIGGGLCPSQMTLLGVRRRAWPSFAGSSELRTGVHSGRRLVR